MTNKRFIFELVEICDVDNDVDDILVEVITDKEENYSYGELDEVVGLLNQLHQENQELKEENEQLRQQLKEKQEEEQLYAKEIVKLNKEAKQVLNFKTLGGDY